jgi:hypothetical protein
VVQPVAQIVCFIFIQAALNAGQQMLLSVCAIPAVSAAPAALLLLPLLLLLLPTRPQYALHCLPSSDERRVEQEAAGQLNVCVVCTQDVKHVEVEQHTPAALQQRLRLQTYQGEALGAAQSKSLSKRHAVAAAAAQAICCCCWHCCVAA